MLEKIAALLLLAGTFILPARVQNAKSKTLGVTPKTSATRANTNGIGTQYSTFDFNWTYTPNMPVCGSVKKACYDGFIMTNTTLNQVVGSTSQIGPAALSYEYSPAEGIPFGTSNFSLVAHGYDDAGAEFASTPATVSITVKATSTAKVTSLVGPTNVQSEAQ
jgi:hypothetical protein